MSTSGSPVLQNLQGEAGADPEDAAARGGLWISVACLLLCPLGALTVGIGPIIPIAGLAGLSAAWFALRRYLGQLLEARFNHRVSFAIALSFPGIYLVLALATIDTRVAISSWVPPQLALAIILVSTFALRPIEPLLIGVFFAAEYAAVAAYVQATVGFPEPYDTFRFHCFRVVTSVLLGVIAAVAVRSLKRKLEQAARELRAKDLLGKYELGEPIGLGGMGSVVAATYCPEGGFERPVAIKRMHAHLARRPEAVASFRAEAELCARLIHPNIVAALDFGSANDTWFLAMERVEGADLASLLDAGRGPVPPEVVVRIGVEVCQGLTYAHEGACDTSGQQLKVVHRDLSPSNVLVSRSGEVKIADFGVASVLRDQESRFSTTIRGKLRYLDPERARSEAFDHRADLFALGVVLWEMLAGTPLFARDTDPACLLAIASADIPSIREHRPELSADWDTFLTQALAPYASARFPSARAMAARLESMMTGAPREHLAAWVRSLLPHVVSTEQHDARLVSGQSLGNRLLTGAATLVDHRPDQHPELPAAADQTEARASADRPRSFSDAVTLKMQPLLPAVG